MTSFDLGSEKWSEYLIEHGLNISAVDNEGNTPIHCALMAGKRKWNNLMKKHQTENISFA